MQNGEEAASSVLGALFLYLDMFGYGQWWDECNDLGNDRRKMRLTAAYTMIKAKHIKISRMSFLIERGYFVLTAYTLQGNMKQTLQR